MTTLCQVQSSIQCLLYVRYHSRHLDYIKEPNRYRSLPACGITMEQIANKHLTYYKKSKLSNPLEGGLLNLRVSGNK